MHTNTHTHMNANSPENGGYLSARRAKIRKQWKAEEQGDCEWNGKDPPIEKVRLGEYIVINDEA